jgi:hypothetical protein
MSLVGYQAPLRGTRLNQASVIYGRLADEIGNPLLPSEEAIDSLLRCDVHRLVVGHTPTGDAPSVVRGRGLEVVMADNSYSREESGMKVLISDEKLEVESRARLDDGTVVQAQFHLKRNDVSSPLGLCDARTGHLIKGRLSDGRWLLFRAHPEYRFEQVGAADDNVKTRSLMPVGFVPGPPAAASAQPT